MINERLYIEMWPVLDHHWLRTNSLPPVEVAIQSCWSLARTTLGATLCSRVLSLIRLYSFLGPGNKLTVPSPQARDGPSRFSSSCPTR